MIQAVFFDLDNTLIDFMRMKRSAVSAAIDAMIAAGVELDKKQATKILYELYDQYGIEYQEIFQKFLQKVHRRIDYKILASGVVAYRKAQPAFLEPYPKVIPTLLALREQGLKIGIVTDAPRMRAWLRLVEMRIHDFFDVVVTFDDTRVYKPDQLPFRKALSALKLSPEQVIMVGDNVARDIRGAKALGMRTVFARYGATKPVLRPGADFVIKSIDELPGIVAKVKNA